MIVRTGLNLAGLFARIAHPFIPEASAKAAAAVGEPWAGPWPGVDAGVELSRIPAGRQVAAPEVLFRKIEDAQVAEWAERFGGAG